MEVTAEIKCIAAEHRRLTGDAEPTLESLWDAIRSLWPASANVAQLNSWWAEQHLETETLEWLCDQHHACWTCWGTGAHPEGHSSDGRVECLDCDGTGYDEPHEPATDEEPRDGKELDRWWA